MMTTETSSATRRGLYEDDNNHNSNFPKNPISVSIVVVEHCFANVNAAPMNSVTMRFFL